MVARKMVLSELTGDLHPGGPRALCLLRGLHEGHRTWGPEQDLSTLVRGRSEKCDLGR